MYACILIKVKNDACITNYARKIDFYKNKIFIKYRKNKIFEIIFLQDTYFKIKYGI